MEDVKVTADQAKQWLDAGDVVFLDTRSPQSWSASDQQLPGSLRVTPDEVAEKARRWRPGTAVVAYCT